MSKRKIFVSYHHKNDQIYYDLLSSFLVNSDVVTDRSSKNKINSTNNDYIISRIKLHHIKGSSCLIVLIGSETHTRKYIDWEIKAALENQKSIIGVVLPYVSKLILPNRLMLNLLAGYIKLEYWSDLFTSGRIYNFIEQHTSLSEMLKPLIINPTYKQYLRQFRRQIE